MRKSTKLKIFRRKKRSVILSVLKRHSLRQHTIQIDVLGIARKKNNVKLFFIEAKKTKLTLRDLGQLWAYCKLIDPEEAFLFSSAGLGSLNKLVQSFRREDLLDFGDGKKIKKMKIAKWDVAKDTVDLHSLIPKI